MTLCIHMEVVNQVFSQEQLKQQQCHNLLSVHSVSVVFGLNARLNYTVCEMCFEDLCLKGATSVFGCKLSSFHSFLTISHKLQVLLCVCVCIYVWHMHENVQSCWLHPFQCKHHSCLWKVLVCVAAVAVCTTGLETCVKFSSCRFSVEL